jgi:hypothetical protein
LFQIADAMETMPHRVVIPTNQVRNECPSPGGQSCEPDKAAGDHFQPQNRFAFAFKIRTDGESKPD